MLTARTLLIALLACAALGVIASSAAAHQDGCHRWHSCPSDTGSYVCGDLGYYTYCGYGPTTTTPTTTTPTPTTTTDLWDCADFSSQASAQAIFDLYADDRYFLDADNDKIACEELPCPCSSKATPTPAPTVPVVTDITPPTADVYAKDPQRLTKQGGLRFAVECDEFCTVGVAASVVAGGRTYRLGSDSSSADAGDQMDFFLRLKSAGRRAVLNALRAHKRVRVYLAVVASDSADNKDGGTDYVLRVRR